LQLSAGNVGFMGRLQNIMIGDGIQIQVLSVSEEIGDVRIQIEAPDVVEAQSRNVGNEVTGRKPGPVIIHKRRWRSLETQGYIT
ncbi:carbon storage regulator-related protein, partial [Pseudomonas syringae pv. actinidiae ICMP 19070]